MNFKHLDESQFKDLRMEILFTAATIQTFLNDLDNSVSQYKFDPKSGFFRRTFIKSLFSCFEGTIWVLKKLCLYIDSVQNLKNLTFGEKCMLEDTNYDLKDNGEVKGTQKFLKIEDNLRFAIKVLNKVIDAEVEIDTNSKTWNDLKYAIQIRNRIMHPKWQSDLSICDEEMTRVLNVYNWLVVFLDKIIEAFKKIETLYENQ